MAEPVSWLVIEPGWKVVAEDGAEVGRVSEVVGDMEDDIFNGLAIATGALARPRYVPAEDVAAIVDGSVQLALSREAIERLSEYEQPATSARVTPDEPLRGRGARSSRSMPLGRRIARWLGRGRR